MRRLVPDGTLYGGIRRIAYSAVVLTVFYYIGHSLWQHWEEISSYHFRPSVPLLLVASFLWVGGFLFFAVNWTYILRSFSQDVSYATGTRIWLVCQLGKYLPGKVGAVLGRYVLCRREGIRGAEISLSVLLESLLDAASGFFVFLLVLPLKSKGLEGWRFLWVVGSLVAAVVALQPRIFYGVINPVLHRLGRQVLDIKISFPLVLRFFVKYLGAWVVVELSFLLFVRSIWEVPFPLLAKLVGVMAISWVLGFLAFFSPGGLGVREGAMTFFLSFYFPTGTAVVIPLAARLWSTLCEVVVIGCTFMVTRGSAGIGTRSGVAKMIGVCNESGRTGLSGYVQE